MVYVTPSPIALMVIKTVCDVYHFISLFFPEGCPPLKSKLNYTYEDFKKKKTGTYVTYVIDTEKAKLPSSRSQLIINVGKGNTTYGYKNGPLTPLHSYRYLSHCS